MKFNELRNRERLMFNNLKKYVWTVRKMMIATRSSSEIHSSGAKSNGFHTKYLEICKSKNLMPLPEVKTKKRNIHDLDFHADRVKADDWIAICKALHGDKTLKHVAIRLRKNTLLVINEADTLKKAKAIDSHPVIYSKFLFGTLVDALKSLLFNSNVLETLVLEGFPMNGIFMDKLIHGLSRNTSLKSLSFARSQVGDSACDSLCTTLKHMMNVETLNLSGCDLGVKSTESIAGLIKLHKIQRFSEAWTQSLRYQNIDAESFPGLRKVQLNNNPDIGDEGLEILTEILLEDVWIKDIEMQNCGLTDVGAQNIIKCLNTNKTILNFNIAGNPDTSEHLCRHIILHLGNCDQDSSDSTSPSKKITKLELLEEVKFLKEQLDQEIYRRKQNEELHDTLQQQLISAQQQIMIQGAFRVPEGFTLIAESTLSDLLKEKSEASPASRGRSKRRHGFKLKKTPSCFTPKAAIDASIEAPSKSETLVNTTGKQTPFIEKNIGDGDHIQETCAKNQKPSTADMMKRFIQRKMEEMLQNKVDQQPDECGGGDFAREPMSSEETVHSTDINPNENVEPNSPQMQSSNGFDLRSLFSNSASRVPDNSDVESIGSDLNSLHD